MLRRQVSYLFIATALLAACRPAERDGGSVEVTFRAAVAATRAVDESTVNTLDVLAFRSDDGAKAACSHADAAQVTLTLPAGVTMDYYVVANAPAGVFDGVNTWYDMMSLTYELPSFSAMPMSCAGRGTFSSDGTATVHLDRLLCRVTLESVVPQFLADTYVTSEVKLTAIYLINARGDASYFGPAPATATWCNGGGRSSLDAAVTPLLCCDVSPALTLSSAAVAGPWVFYCCPNGTSRITRLVLEVTVDGVTYYYPADLPAMERNTDYVFHEALLLGGGSLDPDVTVERTALSFTLSVTPWGSQDVVIKN